MRAEKVSSGSGLVAVDTTGPCGTAILESDSGLNTLDAGSCDTCVSIRGSGSGLVAVDTGP